MATYTWEEIEAMAELKGVPVYTVIDEMILENSNQLN